MQSNELLLTVLAREYPKWHSQALRIVGNPEAAAEVLQTCACKLGRAKIASIHPSRIRPYISQTVHNAAVDYREAKRRARRRHEPLSWQHDKIDPRGTPLEALLETEQAHNWEALAACALRSLERLPVEQGRAVRFMYLSAEPPTLTAFAKAEGIPISTARSRVLAGLSKLRRAVEHPFTWRRRSSLPSEPSGVYQGQVLTAGCSFNPISHFNKEECMLRLVDEKTAKALIDDRIPSARINGSIVFEAKTGGRVYLDDLGCYLYEEHPARPVVDETIETPFD